MIHSYSSVGDDSALPSAPLNLSARMRELRSRQGLKQSEIARRMGLDPSIPSLWEQGKRLVPANRVNALADALGVSVTELLEGVPGAAAGLDGSARDVMVDYTGRAMHALRDAPRILDHSSYMTLVQVPSPPPSRVIHLEEEPPAPVEPPKPFVPAERPVLVGWIPEGWEPDDRVQDIAPTLPEGVWLDPVRMERPAAQELLRSRLCADDRALIGDRVVPGAAMVQRLYTHCAKDEAFLAGRVPLVEAIFRAVLAADYAGLAVDALVEQLRERPGSVSVTATLLRRLRGSLRPYPMRWVDANLR